MPSMFSYRGYKIYFWMSEYGESVHVHICKGRPTANSTKVWITRSGGAILARNTSRIPRNELNMLLEFIQGISSDIVAMWCFTFGAVTYYC